MNPSSDFRPAPLAAVFILFIVAGLAAPVFAQPSPAEEDLPVGHRVRLEFRDGDHRERVTGLLAEADSLHLTVIIGDPRSGVRVRRTEVEWIDVSTGHRSRAGAGFTTGMIGGVSLGILLGLAAGQGGESFPLSSEGIVAGSALTLGLVGGGIGALAGASSREEQWARYGPAPPIARAVLKPLPGGAGIGLALQW